MGKIKIYLKSGVLPLAILMMILIGVIAYRLSHNQNQLLSAPDTCSEKYKKDSKVRIGPIALDVELARTEAEKERGLGGRDCISSKTGMLFVFSSPDLYTFWMKDMKFPIDMIWIGPDKKVVKIESNVSPDTYPHSFTNDDPAQYVLETKANLSTLLRIKDGSQIEF